MFFIPCDIIFDISLSLLWFFFNGNVVAFFETSALEEVRNLSPFSTRQQYVADTKGAKNCRILYLSHFLN